MEAKVFYGIGNNGKLLGLLTYQQIKEHDEEVKRKKKGYPIMPSHILTQIVEKNIMLASRAGDSLESLFDQVEGIYNRNGVFGPYGDIIEITKVHSSYRDLYLMRIGQKSLITTSAADIGIFIKGKDNDNEDIIYSVFGIRKNKPGKGQPAFIAGICDCDESVLDSPFYTILHETKEEAGIEIKCKKGAEDYREDFNVNEEDVFVSLGKQKVPAKIYKTGMYPTGSDEHEKRTKRKRIYVTTSFLLPIDLGDKQIDEKLLEKYFEAGDDVERIVFSDVTIPMKTGNMETLPVLGVSHHKRILQDYVLKAREIYGWGR